MSTELHADKPCPRCGAGMQFRLGDYECPSCGHAQKQVEATKPAETESADMLKAPATPPAPGPWPDGIPPAGYAAFKLEQRIYLSLLGCGLIAIYFLILNSQCLQALFGDFLAGRRAHPSSLKAAKELYQSFGIWIYPFGALLMFGVAFASVPGPSGETSYLRSISSRRSCGAGCLVFGLGSIFLAWLNCQSYQISFDQGTYWFIGIVLCSLLWNERLRWRACQFNAQS